jgi:tRNA (guanine-N7-)-methyltransferase
LAETPICPFDMSKRPREEDEMEAGPSTINRITAMNGTKAGEVLLKVPQKRFYRQRAHANVFIDHSLD